MMRTIPFSWICMLGACTSMPALAATPVIVDSNGVTLGIPWGKAENNPAPNVTVVTRTGYLATYEPTGTLTYTMTDAVGNRIANAWTQFFESDNCSGQPYIVIGYPPSTAAGGVVSVADVDLWGSSPLYVPKSPTVLIKTLLSYRMTLGNCLQMTGTSQVFVPLPNNPAITGVSGNAVGPLHLDIVSDCIFSNGFQCTGP